MELEVQTQAEAGQQAEARDDVVPELELLRRGLSPLPDEPGDQVVQEGYRLRLAPARTGQDPARQVAIVNAKNGPSRSRTLLTFPGPSCADLEKLVGTGGA